MSGALRKVDGVRDVQVDFKTKKVLVLGDEELDEKRLIEALEKAGYPGARVVEPDPKAGDLPSR